MASFRPAHICIVLPMIFCGNFHSTNCLLLMHNLLTKATQEVPIWHVGSHANLSIDTNSMAANTKHLNKTLVVDIRGQFNENIERWTIVEPHTQCSMASRYHAAACALQHSVSTYTLRCRRATVGTSSPLPLAERRSLRSVDGERFFSSWRTELF